VSDAAIVRLKADKNEKDLHIAYTAAAVPIPSSEFRTLSRQLLEALRETFLSFTIPHLVQRIPTLAYRLVASWIATNVVLVLLLMPIAYKVASWKMLLTNLRARKEGGVIVIHCIVHVA